MSDPSIESLVAMPVFSVSGSLMRRLRSLLRRSRLLQALLLICLTVIAAAGWFGPDLLFEFRLRRASACLQTLQFDAAERLLNSLLAARPTAHEPLLLQVS
ncbi:MAG: hypothetical protein ACKOEO_17015, partial [Planctomycetaceae bacterium]